MSFGEAKGKKMSELQLKRKEKKRKNFSKKDK